MRKLFLLHVFICLFAFYARPNTTSRFFFKAKPCWASDRQVSPNLTVALHSLVDVGTYNTASFRITASSCYRLYLNGNFIGYGPSIAAHGFFRVDEYDFSKKLKQGQNIVAIEAVGYNVDNYYIPNQSSFIQAELVVDGKVLAATLNRNEPEAFKMAISGQRISDVPKFSFQRPYMESYKLDKEYSNWRSNKEFILQQTGIEQTDKKNLLPRRVKYPDYSVVTSQQMDNGVFEFATVKTGFVASKVVVNKPSKITIRWDEIVVDGKIQPGRLGYNSFINYELEPGEYYLESFEPYTLKYLELVVNEGDCRIQEATIRQYVNSDVSRAKFGTNDIELNRVFTAAVETYRQNALDVFMDCPSRERAGWLCDSYFTARVAYNLSGNTLIERNFIENYLLPEKFAYIPDGMLPMCYPSDHSNGNFIPNWAMWFVLELEEYIARSGDYQTIVDLKPRVTKLLNYFKAFENEDGLLEKLDKWIFVEWSKANDFVRDVNYPTNMLYSKMLEVYAKLYDAPEYWDKAQRIKEVIRKQSYINGFFTDNAMRENGKVVVKPQNQTEVCQYYAFYFNVATPESHPELWKKLVNDFGVQRNETKKYPQIYPANSFIGNYLRLELLARESLTKQLVTESKKQFAHMVELTGTLWENVTPASSTCHGFASHVAHVFYRDVAGFDKIDQLNKLIAVRFKDCGLTNCSATVPVGEQTISIKWEKKGKTIAYSIDAPKEYKVKIENETAYLLKKN